MKNCMTDKSWVSMAQKQCMVCGKTYDTGEILLDKRLRASMERTTLVGTGLCPEHEQLYTAGYLALVECDPEKTPKGKASIKQEEAYRTGVLVHIRYEVAERLFNNPIPRKQPMAFVEPGVVAYLKKLMEEAEGRNDG